MFLPARGLLWSFFVSRPLAIFLSCPWAKQASGPQIESPRLRSFAWSSKLSHPNGNVLGVSLFSFPSVSQRPWYKLEYIASRVGITPLLIGGLAAVPHLFIVCLKVLRGSGFGDAGTGKGYNLENIIIYDLQFYLDSECGFPQGAWKGVFTLTLLQGAGDYGAKLLPVHPRNPWKSWGETRLPSQCSQGFACPYNKWKYFTSLYCK